jgi:hypothetical protein
LPRLITAATWLQDIRITQWELPQIFVAILAGHMRTPRNMGCDIPHVAPYRKPAPSTIIENTMYLDGEVVHRSVVSRIIHRATHPTSAPLHDGIHSWTPPDSGLVGA